MQRALETLTANASDYGYKEGQFVIGATQDALLGVATDRHAVTCASSRSGKGVAVIIPNLMLWPHNALVIDPKGEALNATHAHRKKRGQKVHALDPFGHADVPDDLRASYNPLDELDLNSDSIREDIEAISDGLVLRPDPSSSHWDDGAVALISGLIAYVMLTQDKEKQNLVTVRHIITDQRHDGLFNETVMKMVDVEGCGGLARAGAAAAMAKEGGYFISNAEKNTRWLDSAPMQRLLRKSTFRLADLKLAKASVFLVLPANYLGQHGRFLRLFVRCGIDAMARHKGKGKCLFMLDEFFALGYIDEIAKSAGLMAGYGLQMWIFLQDLGQLNQLYGKDGGQTFFGNADVHQFFGGMDGETLNFTSQRLGAYTESDLPDAPPLPGGGFVWEQKHGLDADRVNMINRRNMQQATHQMQVEYNDHEKMAGRLIGRPRFSPDEIARIIRKPAPDEIAIGQIVFTHGLKPLYCQLAPFWELDKLKANKPSRPEKTPEPTEEPKPKHAPRKWWESKRRYNNRVRWFGYDISTIWGLRGYLNDPRTGSNFELERTYQQDKRRVIEKGQFYLFWAGVLGLILYLGS